ADTATGPALSAALGRAVKLRALVQKSRPLEPSDFNGAASPATPLDEATEIGLVTAGAGELSTRATALKNALDAARSALAKARTPAPPPPGGHAATGGGRGRAPPHPP